MPAVQVVVADAGDGAVAADFPVAPPEFLLLVHVRPLSQSSMPRT
jgi:hypothetical protein